MFEYKEFVATLGTSVLAHPLISALTIADFIILLFHRPPFLFSFPMLLGLVGLAMYFSWEVAKLELGGRPRTDKSNAAMPDRSYLR